MPEPELVESIEEYPKPFTNLFIGVVMPAALIGHCAAIGVLLALAFGGGEREMVLTGAYFGAMLGFLVSFYGIAELLVAFFFSSGPALNRICRAAGYAAIWSVAVSLLLWLR